MRQPAPFDAHTAWERLVTSQFAEPFQLVNDLGAFKADTVKLPVFIAKLAAPLDEEYPVERAENQLVYDFSELLIQHVMGVCPRIARPYPQTAEALVTTLQAVRLEVEKNRLPASRLLFSRAFQSPIVKYASHLVDPMMKREQMLEGWIGSMMSAVLRTGDGRQTRDPVPENVVFAASKAGAGYLHATVEAAHMWENGAPREYAVAIVHYALNPRAWASVVLE